MAGVVALLAVSGCGGVDIEAPEVSGAERRACEELVDALPESVGDEEPRETEGSPLGRAWGDPAIVLRCGVGAPEGYAEFPTCQQVDGVDWYVPEAVMSDQGADATITTIGREPNVEVVVPAEQRPPDAVLVDLAGVVSEHTEVVRSCD